MGLFSNLFGKVKLKISQSNLRLSEANNLKYCRKRIDLSLGAFAAYDNAVETFGQLKNTSYDNPNDSREVKALDNLSDDLDNLTSVLKDRRAGNYIKHLKTTLDELAQHDRQRGLGSFSLNTGPHSLPGTVPEDEDMHRKDLIRTIEFYADGVKKIDKNGTLNSLYSDTFASVDKYFGRVAVPVD